MEWNQEVFVKNVERLLGNRKQRELNDFVGRDAVTRWKKGDRPSLEILLRVSDYFHCGIDDLVCESKESNGGICPPKCPLVNRAPEIVESVRKAIEVIGSGTHYGESLIKNIDSFHEGLKSDRVRVDNYQSLLDEILKRLDSLEEKGGK